MPTSSPFSAVAMSPELERNHPDLLNLRHQLARHDLAVHLAAVHEWRAGLRLSVENDAGRPSFWVYGPADRDPSRGRGGRTVIPGPAHQALKKIAALEMPGHRIAIAHEVRAERVAALVPRARPGTQPCPDDVARALVGPAPAHPTVARAVHWMDAVIGGGADAVRSVARTTGDALLDPIVFAVFALGGPRDGEPALWLPLVAWRW